MRIKKFFSEFRKKRFIKKMSRLNPNPTEYKIWEHQKWGNSIQVRRIDKNTFSIVGWLPNKPHNGDKLIYKTKGGHDAFGYIVDVKYCGDPRDMFFANVVPIGLASL